MAGAALLAEPRSPHTHTHMQEEEEEGGLCIFMPGSQEGAGPAGTANRGPLAQSRPAGTAGTARPLGRGSAGSPTAAGARGEGEREGKRGGFNALLAISPLLVISPASCRGGPAGAGRCSACLGVPSGAGPGGEGMRGAGMRGRPQGARRCTGCRRQRRRAQTDRHTHTHPSTALPAGSAPAAGDGTGWDGRKEPPSLGRRKAPSKVWDFERCPCCGRTGAGINWDKMGYKATWLAELLASGLTLLPRAGTPLFAVSSPERPNLLLGVYSKNILPAP